jgi:hypothetical protein
VPGGTRDLYLLQSFHTGSVVQPASYVMRIGALSRGLKRLRRKADYGLPSSAENKTAVNYSSSEPYALLTSYLIKFTVALFLQLQTRL